MKYEENQLQNLEDFWLWQMQYIHIPILFQEHEQTTWKVFTNRSCRYVYFRNIIRDKCIFLNHKKNIEKISITEFRVFLFT